LKKQLFILSIVLLSFTGISFKAKAQSSNTIDYCQIYGGVYFVDDRSKASFSIYLEESEVFANLKVYQETNLLFADGTGKWYVTENLVQAQYRVYIESKRSLADFSVNYVTNESYAGCNK
jgi:hypothetical protein